MDNRQQIVTRKNCHKKGMISLPEQFKGATHNFVQESKEPGGDFADDTLLRQAERGSLGSLAVFC